MGSFDAEQVDTREYKVVVNHEEQYSIWLADRANPAGWRDVGKSGQKADCLEYINVVWTDMRPLSLRQQMADAAREREQQPPAPSIADTPQEEPLPIRLSRGEHPVMVSLRPERTLQAFRERLDLGYVHVKFSETRGGTELGFPVDKSLLDLSRADFDKGVGTIRLQGPLTLDYVKVQCIADIDLATLNGLGRLEIVAQ